MSFDQRVIKNGRLSMGLAIIANFLPAIVYSVMYGTFPGIGGILTIWGTVAASYGVSWVVQVIAYHPTMGAAGSYIGWLAGSCGDIRMPAASIAQTMAEVEPGTHEGTVIGTIGVAMSVLVSASIITIFIFIGNAVIPLFPQFITDSFSHIQAALFAAVYIDMMKRDVVHGVISLVVGFALYKVMAMVGISTAFITVGVIVATVLIARVMYVSRAKKNA